MLERNQFQIAESFTMIAAMWTNIRALPGLGINMTISVCSCEWWRRMSLVGCSTPLMNI